ncbi:MAG: hypothetical protein K2O52_04685 [Oscillospiraceae bacterium]|nr:hypothetical protein [Oscillospiraceae bacterium]
MLTKLLSRNTCAECKLCCIFSRYNILDTPVLSPEIRKECEQLLPDIKFISKGKESYLFRMDLTEEQDLFSCPLLNPESGCMLGTEKPFDCQIWPFEITEINHKIAITISNLCDVMMQQPIYVLIDFLKQGLAEKIFSYAEQNPDVIRPYDYINPVLLWKHEKF